MKFMLRLIVSLILIGVIVWELGDLGEVAKLMLRISPLFILLILMVNTFDRALMTFKWVWLLRGRGMYLPFLCGMKIYCASMVWGMFLPATVGADAIRAFSASRTGLDSNEVVASIVIERMVGFLSALLLGLCSLFLLSFLGDLDARFDLIWWLGGATLVGATIAFAASFSQTVFSFLSECLLQRFRDTRIMRRLQRFYTTYQTYQHNKRNLTIFFGLTFGEQLIPILHSWLIAHGLGIEVSLLFIAGAVPLTILVSRIPISVNGLGVFDGVFILLMSLADVSATEAIVIVFIGRILQTASWLPWWLAHVVGGGNVRAPQLVTEES